MNAYLDASVVIPMIIADVHNGRVDAWLTTQPTAVLSPWTVAECASVFSFKVRTGAMKAAERVSAEAELDRVLARLPPMIVVDQEDFLKARRLMQADASLRAPDALHLAIAEARGLSLATLDEGLARAARTIGVTVERI